MSVTIRDVAKAAGVSLKTVSRVINDERWVRADTRERVMQAVKALDFHPNPLARSLVTRQTRTLGLVVPDVANPFFARGIDGCVASAEQRGYNLFLSSAGDDPDREARQVQALLAQHISGLILWVSNLADEDLEGMMRRMQHPCPVVFIDRPSDPTRTLAIPHACVLVAQGYVGSLATEHLLNEGRRRIAYVGVRGAGAGGWVADQRFGGYEDALASRDEPPQDRWVRRVEHATIREGATATATLLVQRPLPDAIFAYNDLLAVGALQACRRARVRVPDDVAIVGVDDTEMAAVTHPPLTTIRLHQQHTGARATALALALIEGDMPPAVNPALQLPDLIVRRSSTARLPDGNVPDEGEDVVD